MNRLCAIVSAACLALCLNLAAKAPPGFNEDEAKVPPYTLPDVLTGEDGKQIETAAQWQTTRRPEVMRMLEQRMFGQAPALPTAVRSKMSLAPADAVGGLATRQQVTLLLSDRDDGPFMDILISELSKRPRFWLGSEQVRFPVRL